MFGSDILEVCIGIVFVFVLVSTICSAVREGIESYLKTRAAYLEHGIRQLLSDATGTNLAQKFFDHPLISSLSKGTYAPSVGSADLKMNGSNSNLPSYIPSRNFALAIMDIAARGPQGASAASATSVPITLDSIRANVANLGDPRVQRVLLTAIDAAQGDINRVQASLEAWYDGGMERVSGWYKRTTHRMLFAIALFIAISMNVNTIAIADYLYRHDAQRSALVASVEKQGGQTLGYEEAKKQLDEMGLPIGWSGETPQTTLHWPQKGADYQWWNEVWSRLLGWLITAFAATLGAPFWFDVLSKVTSIRSTIKPRDKDTPAEQIAATPTVVTTAGGAPVMPGAPDDPGEDTCGVGEHAVATPDNLLPAAEGGVR